MLDDERPYFLTNKDWWYMGDDDEIHIKDDAPEEAKKSFREWVSMDWLDKLMGE